MSGVATMPAEIVAVSAPCEACGSARRRSRAIVGPHRIYRCLDCSLTFVRKATGQGPACGDYYARIEPERFASYYQEFQASESRRILSRLQRLGVAGRLLDVGCSYGWFLQEARRAGFAVTGLEPSQTLAHATADRVPGGRVLVGDAGLLADLQETFDVMTFLDVLEHLPQPVEVLRLARQRLARSGWLVVRVPDARGLIHRTAFLAYALSLGRVRAPIEALAQVENDFMHLFFFSPRTLELMLKKSGFRVVHVEGCDIIDDQRLANRVQLSGATTRYARWNHPVVSWALGALQVTGRWTGCRDEFVAYAQAI